MTGCRVVVIGGGASGLAAAVSATQNGAEVTVLEHKDRVGKKILMTGNGKCNLTNVSDYHGKYFSSDEKSLEKIYKTFECFGADKTIEFFENKGLFGGEGQLSLNCEDSGSTLRFLMQVALLSGREVIMSGKGRLMQRPQKPYFDLFDKIGVEYELSGDSLRLKGKLTA